MRLRSIAIYATVSSLMLAASTAAGAAQCGNGPGGFDSWLERFRSQAAAAGIKPAAVSAGLGGVTYDPGVIHLDHSQHSFKLSFAQFYARRVDGALIGRG